MNILIGPATTAIRRKMNEVVTYLNSYLPSGALSVDTISEKTSGSGVTVDGVLLKDSTVKTDTIIRTQAAPVNSNTDPADKAVMAASFITGLLTATPGGAIDYTLPTGTQMDTACASRVGANAAFDFNIINIGAGGIITFIAASGFTIVGVATVAAATSATFRVRKTAANTFVLYRIA